MKSLLDSSTMPDTATTAHTATAHNSVITTNHLSVEAKVAVEKVAQICKARMDYNHQLMSFYLKSTRAELIEHHFAMHRDIDAEAINFDQSKQRFVAGCSGDYKSYEEFYNFILLQVNEPRYIDNLHWQIVLRHSVEKSSISDSAKTTARINAPQKFKKKIVQHRNNLNNCELRYLTQCLNILEDHISAAERGFCADFKLVHKIAPETGDFFIDHTLVGGGPKNNFVKLEQCHHYILQINDLLNSKRNILVQFTDILPPDFKTNYLTLIQKTIELYSTINNKNKDVFKEDYYIVHEAHCLLKKYQSELTHLLSSNSINKLKAAHAQNTNPQLDLTPALVATQKNETLAVSHKPAAIDDDLIKKKENESDAKRLVEQKLAADELLLIEKSIAELKAFKEEVKLRTDAFKDTVNQQRKEKDAFTQQHKEKQKNDQLSKDESDALTLKKQSEGLMLLSKLNPSNFALLQTLFSKPAPHLQVSYQKIQTLIGKESGKLPGEIKAEDGSHRKIVINGALGFFDELPEYTDQKPSATTGSLFKPHGKKHSSKLPRIAIQMIISTLEKAGITPETMELFNRHKQKASAENVMVNAVNANESHSAQTSAPILNAFTTATNQDTAASCTAINNASNVTESLDKPKKG